MDELFSFFDAENTDELPATLPPEVEEGNVEYKLKLVNPSQSRFEHLVTQMKWRLQEGEGEAIYEIGVEDNGMLAGLTDIELDASLSTLQRMAAELRATITVLRERHTELEGAAKFTRINQGYELSIYRLGATITVLRERHTELEGAECQKRALEILVRKVPDDQAFLDLRLAVLGNVDAGKSTLIGVLTQGELDNGRGRARLNLFRHLHEIQTGRTSSISHEILGFDNSGEVVNYSESRTVEDICENSSKLITFIDLAGHQKYQKTTIFGLTGYNPDFAMLVVSANTGMAGTTKEHLGFSLALDVPVFVVVTKVDACRKVMIERTVSQLESILKSPGCKRIPFRIKTEDDAITAAASFDSERITPIFTVSSVSGKDIGLLTKFLNVVPPTKKAKDREKLTHDYTDFQIDTLFSVPGVGSVVGGTIHRGSIKETDMLQLGPFDDGSFQQVKVKTVHRNRLPCRLVQAGQAATVALCDVPRDYLRRGMVLVSVDAPMEACRQFEADIFLLFHSNQIQSGFETTIHIGSVCQTCRIEKIFDKDSIKTNEKALVVFRLLKQPECLKIGSRFLFRQGTTKGVGEVTKIYPLGSDSPAR